MTNRILQSDIDAAKRLIQGQHSDAEIVDVLVRRRIDPTKAAQMVAALRAGHRVEPEMEINYEVGQGGPVQGATAAPVPESEERRHRPRAAGGKRWILWLVVLVLLGGAIAYLLKMAGEQPPAENFQPGVAEETNGLAPLDLPGSAPAPVDTSLSSPETPANQ